MCDLEGISQKLVAVQVLLLFALGLIVVALFNAGSFLSAATNVGVMAIAIGSTAAATALLFIADSDAHKCLGGPCGDKMSDIIFALDTMRFAMATFSALLLAIAIVAAIPVAGAVVIASNLPNLTWAAGSFTASMAAILGFHIARFNDCQKSNAQAGQLSAWILILGIACLVVSFVGVAAYGDPELFDLPVPPKPPAG